MNRQSLRIGKRSYLISLGTLLILMIVAGLLTMILPAGAYDRVIVDSREMIVEGSFRYIDRPSYSPLLWFIAPFEVLIAQGAAIVWVIIVFLLFIGASFTVLLRSGMVERLMDRLTARFSDKKYRLLSAVSLFFMLFGACFGVFEELIVLVPFCLILARKMGWDSLTGLGMSLLSAGIGFGAAVFNPFTLGVAQKLAGLPLYSGTPYRIAIFVTSFLIVQVFLRWYARRIEKSPKRSLVYQEDSALDEEETLSYPEGVDRALRIFALFLVCIVVVLVASFFISVLSDISFPLIAVLFLAGSLASVFIARVMPVKEVWRALVAGLLGVAPAIALILMAMSIKQIVVRGGVMDTILYAAVSKLGGMSPTTAILWIWLLVLVVNFFIGSGSAKAFLVLPILFPIVDVVGLSRQLAVQAFLFGDGFSNLLYPTNAALMIGLGFSPVGYVKWLRWELLLQLGLAALSLGWLYIGYFIGL
jgi:uncharacterized ion transporter superfamily protein YfcC